MLYYTCTKSVPLFKHNGLTFVFFSPYKTRNSPIHTSINIDKPRLSFSTLYSASLRHQNKAQAEFQVLRWYGSTGRYSERSCMEVASH